MSSQRYTDDELQQYFQDPAHRRQGQAASNGTGSNGRGGGPPRYGRYRTFLYQRLWDRDKVEAAFALSVLTGFLLFCTLAVGLYMLTLTNDMPSITEIENPNLELASVAYTADGVELGRFGRENRSWVKFEDISPNIIDALIATEDHRFYDHWGVDLFRTFSAIGQTLLGDVQGGSTITQQLARNLYNEQIGFDRSPTRKLKEMVTAVMLERRYTKPEIIEMYLNTVPFGYNAYGIEAASRTLYGKSAAELDVLESATLVGMLKAITRYSPVRNPELSRQRRNVVMRQMIKHGVLDVAFYDARHEELTPTNFRSADVTDSFAPYFAEYVRNWLAAWGKAHDIDVYAEGLVVFTTLDSRLQTFATEAVDAQMKGLQAVVDYEWSRPSNYRLGNETGVYLQQADYTPFSYFWESEQDLVMRFVRESERYRLLRKANTGTEAAFSQLRSDTAFMDSLRTEKTRLEAGLVSIDPRTGYVKAWVGGRDLATDWYDHVATAKRQPGSTFKPFVYTAAIDNGYSPNYTLPDTFFTYVDPVTGQRWRPRNSGGGASGRMMTLRQGLAFSKNTITAQVVTQLIEPSTAAFYARRMGIQSPLDEVPSLALGTSDVSLLELTSAYCTLANGGLYYEPIVVTRIQDKNGNVLFEIKEPTPREALSEETAFTVVDMMRGVVDYGTAIRLRGQFNLGGYDFAGKTGTTQESADGWFMLMHPQLVTGAWVGFNDRRVTFRSSWWGQGAHNALFLVGDYMQRTTASPDVGLSKKERFPDPQDYALPTPLDEFERERVRSGNTPDRDRVGW